jgi:electron-transferring-flavoprotein dehydrogenase
LATGRGWVQDETQWADGADESRVTDFDREKCSYRGACLWNCASASPEIPERMAVAFRFGTGGLHSAEN